MTVGAKQLTRDVLVLYAAARDLKKKSGATASDADVLLPLHGDQSGAQLEAQHLRAPALGGSEVRDEDRPTVNDPSACRGSAFSVITPVSVSLRRAH
ncbi:MAG: hypothetical protein ABIR94_03735 [Rubrivivax sp.]